MLFVLAQMEAQWPYYRGRLHGGLATIKWIRLTLAASVADPRPSLQFLSVCVCVSNLYGRPSRALSVVLLPGTSMTRSMGEMGATMTATGCGWSSLGAAGAPEAASVGLVELPEEDTVLSPDAPTVSGKQSFNVRCACMLHI